MKQTYCLTNFSLREARRLVQDLFVPRPWIYWCDFLVSVGFGGAAFYGTGQFRLFAWQQIACYFVSVFAMYRASLFTHELSHLRAGTFRGFRAAWNLLFGMPFLMPSFTYHTHIAHHVRKYYGTPEDGEYLPLTSGPPRNIVWYLAQSPVIPLLAIARFLVLSPIAWISPRFRRCVQQRASSLVIDPAYVRPLPTRRELWVWRVQEAGCFLFLVATIVLLSVGRLPLHFLARAYLLALGVILLNAVRTLGAHRYLHRGEDLTFVDQLLDSVNYPNSPLTAELWAPVGLRFHALHHLFPGLPYHSLAEAHRRLMANLPADSPYRQTESRSLWASLRELWHRAQANSQASADREVKAGVAS